MTDRPGVTGDTRTRLLAAAEKILVEQGVKALSVPRIGDGAGLNPTLVTYHFKSILGLLDELCSLNLEPILRDWREIDRLDAGERALDDVLRLWLAPMLHAAALTPSGRALAVLDEIAAHGEPALRTRVLGEMEAFSVRLRSVLAPLLPRLSEDELRARLRFIAGAVLGPPPRTYSAPPSDGGKALDDLAYLLPFARAALCN